MYLFRMPTKIVAFFTAEKKTSFLLSIANKYLDLLIFQSFITYLGCVQTAYIQATGQSTLVSGLCHPGISFWL